MGASASTMSVSMMSPSCVGSAISGLFSSEDEQDDVYEYSSQYQQAFEDKGVSGEILLSINNSDINQALTDLGIVNIELRLRLKQILCDIKENDYDNARDDDDLSKMDTSVVDSSIAHDNPFVCSICGKVTIILIIIITIIITIINIIIMQGVQI